MKKEYKEYSNYKYLNENVIKTIKDGLSAIIVFCFVAFLPFLCVLFFIISKDENTSTRFYITFFVLFIIFDLFICLFTSLYNDNLAKINDIIKEYESYFSISLYKALVGISKEFYIINIIYLVSIAIGSVYYSIIHFKAH